MAQLIALLSLLLCIPGLPQSCPDQNNIIAFECNRESESQPTCDEYIRYQKMELQAENFRKYGEYQKAIDLTFAAWQLTKEVVCLQDVEAFAHFNYASSLGANKKYKEADAEFTSLLNKLELRKKDSSKDLIQSVRINQIINTIHLENFKQAEILFKSFLNFYSEDRAKTSQLFEIILQLYVQKNKFSQVSLLYENYAARIGLLKATDLMDHPGIALAMAKTAEGLSQYEKFTSILSLFDNSNTSNFTTAEKMELDFLRIKSKYYIFLSQNDCNSLEIIQKDLISLVERFEIDKSSLSHPKDIEAAAYLHEPLYTLLFETVISAQENCHIQHANIAFRAMEMYKRNRDHKTSSRPIAEDSNPIQVQQSLKELLAELPSENHVLIYWYTGRYSAYALIVSLVEVRLVRIDDISTTIEDIKSLNNSLHSFSIRKYLEDEAWQTHEKKLFQELSYSIYEKLIPPLRINQYKHWHISPDLGLQSLQFDVLISKKVSVNQSWSQFNYLIKNYTVNYFVNSEQFLRKSYSRSKEYGILSIKESNNQKNQSPQTSILNTKEVNFLHEKFKVTNRYDRDFKNKEEFWTEAEKHKILHFALHGKSDGYDENVIIFENFLLSSEDIAFRNLDTELVVLASCQSSFGAEMKGNTQRSILQAFKSAGAHNAIAMKWDAEDETTADILEKFYFYVGEGWNKSNALRKAKLVYLEQTSNFKSHPFFWAAADVYADMESTKFKVSQLELLKVALFFSIPLILVSLLLYKNKKTSHINF